MIKFKSIPPTYFYACIIICIPFYFFTENIELIHFPYNLFGIILIVIGIYLVINPWYLFKKHNTPETFDTSTTIVQEGIYKYSRNPMYLGGTLFLIGLSITTGNIYSFISPVVFFLIIQKKFIPFEEEKMQTTFGKQYIEYKNKVRRWL